MPIASTDIVYRLSGGAGNTDPTLALGGAMSTVAGGIITSGSLHNLFDAITGDQAAAGRVEFRCIYVQNTHASLTLRAPKLWISSLTSSPGTEFDVAVASVDGSNNAETVANEITAPVGEAFVRPTSKADAATLSLGDIAPGAAKAVWVRYTTTAGAAAANDTGTFRVEGDTDP